MQQIIDENYCLVEPRILGLIVLYDKWRAPQALNYFRHILGLLSSKSHLASISNSDDISFSDFKGSNLCGEFSGWNELLSLFAIENFDIIIFANDTFAQYDRFNNFDVKHFRKAMLELNQSKFMLGEISWGIDYSELLKCNRFLLRYVRTSIFACSSSAIQCIKEIALAPQAIDSLVHFASEKSLAFDPSVPRLFCKRIEAWLFGKNDKNRWHSAPSASSGRLLLKAKCVLQELLLSRRCEDNSIGVFSYKCKSIARHHLFTLIYKIQNLFFYVKLP